METEIKNALLLSDDEIFEITKKKHKKAQIEELDSLGIMHRERADGSIIVLRSHAIKELGGEMESKATYSKKRQEPNWSAMHA